MPKFVIHILIITIGMVMLFLIGLGAYAWQDAKIFMLTKQCEALANNLSMKISESVKIINEKNNELNNKTTNWYGDFISKITQLKRANDKDEKCTSYSKDGVTLPKPLEVDCVEGLITENEISEIFYVKENNIALALIPGVYGGSGFKLVKYDTASGTLEVAGREDLDGGKNTGWFKKSDANMNSSPEQRSDIYYWFATPDKIVSLADGTLELSGESGDAGCSRRSIYSYDIVKNYISIKGDCNRCDEEKEKCVKY